MNKLLIICFGYDGEHSTNPNSLCLYEMIDELSRIYEVTIITSTIENNFFMTRENNIELYYFPIEKRRNSRFNFKQWKKDIINFIKGPFKEQIKEMTYFLTISFPFNTLEVGYHIKKIYPHLKWSIYELDPYAYNLVLRLHKSLFIYRLLKESRVFRKADNILLTHELFHQYSRNFYSKYKSKFKDIGIPLMKIHNKESTKTKDNVNLTYVGSFYKKVRDPDYMFQTLLHVSKDIQGFELNLYGPNPSEINTEYKKAFGNKLLIHGRVSKEKINNVIEDADFLINIGNTTNNQLPSKVLEYIGTGKPIINFYSIEDDTSNKYLLKYPKSLIVKQQVHTIKTSIDKITKFILSNKGKRISTEKLLIEFSGETTKAISKRVSKSLR